MDDRSPSRKTLADIWKDAQRLAAEVEQALTSARPCVRSEYDRCLAKIQAVTHPSGAPGGSCQTTIYRSSDGPLHDVEITLIRDLLGRQGWDVRLAASLTREPGTRTSVLVYHHNHRSDEAVG